MSDLKDVNETMQRMNRLKEALERQKRREPGTFERYNYEILNYLRYKFPEESESSIREAAAFISNQTAVVIHDINEEMSREYMKAFYDMIKKKKRGIGDDDSNWFLRMLWKNIRKSHGDQIVGYIRS